MKLPYGPSVPFQVITSDSLVTHVGREPQHTLGLAGRDPGRPSVAHGGQKPDASDVFTNWPAGASPREFGKRVAENFAARPFERPDAYVIYPEVCTWYGALTLASLTGDGSLKARLIRKFDPLWTSEGAKHISRGPHVDYRVFGVVPLEIYTQTRDARYLELGLSFADRQWETTTGRIGNVCEGTPKGATVEYYLGRRRNVGDLHGQAPVLWSASALLR